MFFCSREEARSSECRGPNARWPLVAFSVTVFVVGFSLGSLLQPEPVVRAQSERRVFELRTYTAADGKLDALEARFRDHVTRLFEKHGIVNVGYWIPQDPPLSQNTFIYILAHPNRQAAKKNWEAFQNDPEWQKLKPQPGESSVTKVESVFMDPTDFSPMK